MSNFSFGFKSTAPATNFSFGNAAPTTAAGGGGFNFAAPTTQNTAFGAGFNTAATPAAGGFGGFKSTTAAPSFGAFTTPVSQTPAGLGGFGSGFAAPASTTTSTSSSFGTGFFSSSSAPKKQVTFSGLGAVPSTTSTLFSSTNPTPLFQPATSVGLGGFDLKKVQTSGLASNEVTRIGEAKSVKDQVVLPEILATVEQFSAFVKVQKKVREDITRISSKNMFNVQKECSALRKQLHEVAAMLQKNTTHIEKFKRDAIQDLKDSETAQRTKDTPIGLQPENLQPIEYFQRLVDSFESQMVTYRQQFLEAEQFYSSLHRTPTPAELSSVFEKLNEGFVALATRLQVVDEAVKRQKEAYLRYKQTHHYDHTDIFKRPVNQTNHATLTTIGPTPFSYVSNMASVAMTSAVNQH